MTIQPVPGEENAVRPAPGFTLLEMLVAVALVAILASIAFPSFQFAMTKARRTEARASLLKTMQLQEQHYSRFNTYFPFDANSELNGLPFRAYASETAATSHYGLDAKACGPGPGETIDSCVLVTATPGAAKGGQQFDDALCGTLSLTSSGIRTASGKGGGQCWH